MGKIKKNKEKRIKSDVINRTKDERQSEVMNIIKQISEFELTTQYDPIKQLYVLFRKYINEYKRIEVNIPFPMIHRRIRGILATSVNEKVWIKLESEI